MDETFTGPDRLVYHYAPPEDGFVIVGFTLGRTIQVSQYNPARLDVTVALGPNADVWQAIGQAEQIVTQNLEAIKEQYAANAMF